MPASACDSRCATQSPLWDEKRGSVRGGKRSGSDERSEGLGVSQSLSTWSPPRVETSTPRTRACCRFLPQVSIKWHAPTAGEPARPLTMISNLSGLT